MAWVRKSKRRLRSKRRWTLEERILLRNLAHDHTVEEIAQRLERGWDAIRAKLRRDEVPRRPVRPAQIFRELQISPARFLKIRRLLGIPGRRVYRAADIRRIGAYLQTQAWWVRRCVPSTTAD